MKEESNYRLIPGQWANELHDAVEFQGKLFLTTARYSQYKTRCQKDLTSKDICVQHEPACHELLYVNEVH